MTSNMHSAELDKIASAMVAAQQAIVPATKDKANPFFKSKYADLEAVWAACRDALHQNGIAVIQGAMTIDGKPHMETKLVHVSGQWMTSFWELMPTKPDPQAMGSAITYQRRYSLAAMVGVITEDDDGNAASGKAKKEEKARSSAAERPALNRKAEGSNPSAPAKTNGKKAPDEWWSGDSLAIPVKDDWQKWDGRMYGAIDAAPNFDALMKLQMDNADNLDGYFSKHAAAHKNLMAAFVKRAGDLSQENPK